MQLPMKDARFLFHVRMSAQLEIAFGDDGNPNFLGRFLTLGSDLTFRFWKCLRRYALI